MYCALKQRYFEYSQLPNKRSLVYQVARLSSYLLSKLGAQHCNLTEYSFIRYLRVGKFWFLEVQCGSCRIKFSIDRTHHFNVIVLIPIKRILHHFSHSDPRIEKDVNYQFIEMTQDILKKKDCCGNQNTQKTWITKVEIQE